MRLALGCYPVVAVVNSNAAPSPNKSRVKSGGKKDRGNLYKVRGCGDVGRGLASFLVPEAEGAKERTQEKHQVDLTLPRTHVCDPFPRAERARDDGQSSTTSACSCAWRFD